MNILLPLAALAAGFSFAPAAVAEVAPRTATVRIADLDLSSVRGQARLDRRLARAAAVVCRSETSLGSASQARACTDATLAHARSAMAARSGASVVEVASAR